jgi:hypothetical protein
MRDRVFATIVAASFAANFTIGALYGRGGPARPDTSGGGRTSVLLSAYGAVSQASSEGS